MAAITKLRVHKVGDVTEVDALVLHPTTSDPGTRQVSSPEGAERYIQRMIFLVNDRVVAEARMGPGVAERPMAGIGLTTLKPGDKIGVTWTDNEANSGHAETRVS